MPSTCPSRRAPLTLLPEVLSSPPPGPYLPDEARTMSDAYLAPKLAIAPRVV
jgi:hypothetical protein